MELEAVIEPHHGQLAEVRDMNRGARAIELDADGALRGLDDSALVAGELVLGRAGLLEEPNVRAYRTYLTTPNVPRPHAAGGARTLLFDGFPRGDVLLVLDDVDGTAIDHGHLAQRREDLVLMVGRTLSLRNRE